MTVTVLDPTDETTPQVRERCARPESLAGLTVGLLDISKPRGNVFLDQIQKLVRDLPRRLVQISFFDGLLDLFFQLLFCFLMLFDHFFQFFGHGVQIFRQLFLFEFVEFALTKLFSQFLDCFLGFGQIAFAHGICQLLRRTRANVFQFVEALFQVLAVSQLFLAILNLFLDVIQCTDI